MRARTVSFSSDTEDETASINGHQQSHILGNSVESLTALNLHGSRSQPSLRRQNNNNSKTNRDLTAIDARLTKLQDRVQQTLAGGSSVFYAPRSHPKRAQTSNGNISRHQQSQQIPQQQQHSPPQQPHSLSQSQSKHRHQDRKKQQHKQPRQQPGRRIGSQLVHPLITIDSSLGKDFAVQKPIVAVPPTTQMFADERLQNFAVQYDREVNNFASVALHAEVRLKQLDLMGDVPNKLALAVTLDVLRRLGSVSGRYEDILRRVHAALLPHCYLNSPTGNTSSMVTATTTATPSSPSPSSPSSPTVPTVPSSTNNNNPERLVDYLQEKPIFSHVESVDRDNKQLHKQMEKLRSDRLSSISMLSDGQKEHLVWDALHCHEPFSSVHVRSAIDRDRTKALKSIWTHYRDEKDPRVTAKHLRELLHNARFAAKLNVDTWDPVASQNYRNDVVKGLFNIHGSDVKEPEEDTATETFELDETMYAWLLDSKNTQICSELVIKLQDNVDEDKVVITVTNENGKQSQDTRKKALETFLLGATEDDVNMLRTMVLTYDYQNGVEWKLVTENSEQEEKTAAQTAAELSKAQADEQAILIKQAIDEDRKKMAAEEQARIAQKAIFAFKTNVTGKIAQRLQNNAKKKKLKKMMTKFRTTALMCVRGPMAGNLKFEEKEHDQEIQCTGDDIDKEIAALMKRLGQEERNRQQKQWASVLNDELSRASEYKGKKKMVIDHKALPPAFGSQITSFRMAYKDIKRFKTKSVPALVRLAFEVYAKHAIIYKRKKGTKKKRIADKIFSMTLYAHFLERYGLPEIADANMVGLASNLVENRHKDPRLDAFAKFCFGEMNEHVATGYTIGITLLAETSNIEQLAFAKLRPGGEMKRLSITGDNTGPSSPKSKRRASMTKKKPSRRSSTKSKNEEELVEIPTEDWWCSISSIKGAMSKAMGSTRKETWKLFIQELEGKATLIDTKIFDVDEEKKDETTSPSRKSKSPRKRSTSQDKSSVETSPSLSPQKNATGKKKNNLLGLAKLRQVAKSTKLKKSKDAHPYRIGNNDFRNIVKADVVLTAFLEYWSSDLSAKEKHLAYLFEAADVDGDGELTTSEFTSLIHSVDPEVPQSEIISMYKNALKRTGTDCLDPSVFVAMCYENGLVHRAWDRHNDMYDIANTNGDLQKAWKVAQPFVLGTLRALERDLPIDHPLRTGTEAGDGSLSDIKMQLQNMQKFSANEDTTKMAWHSYWMLLKHVGEAASEGPGVQTIYGNDIPGTRRIEEDTPQLELRSVKETPHKERKRRNALPFIMFPDVNRVCGHVAKWGPAGGRRRDYIIPDRLRLNVPRDDD